jgi:hypothetical protein
MGCREQTTRLSAGQHIKIYNYITYGDLIYGLPFTVTSRAIAVNWLFSNWDVIRKKIVAIP